MSKRTVASSPEEILDTRVDEGPSRDEALTQSRNRASTGMILASRPRRYDSASELARAVFGTGPGDSEESQYNFTSPSRIISQSFPTNTVVHLRPSEIKNHSGMKGQEEVPQYEITQNGVKFKGNARGIKIIATQVTSKAGQDTTSEYQKSGDEEEKYHSQSQGNQDSGFVIQSGALFFQSVTDSEAEVNQSVSVGRKEFCNVKQDGIEVEGEATGCSFIPKQRVWERSQCQCSES